MNKAFLRATATIFFGFFTLMAILVVFGMLKYVDLRKWMLITLFSGLAGGSAIRLLRELPASAKMPTQVRKPKQFSLKVLLFQVTAISLLLGLAQVWPILAAATAGAFVCRTFSPKRSLNITTIVESILSATLAAILSLVPHVNFSNLGPGVMCLYIVLGATIGEFLSSISPKSRSENK